MVVVQGYRNGKPFDLEVDAIDEHGNMLRADAAFDFRRMAAAALAEAGIVLHVNRAWSSLAKQKEMRRIYEWQLAEYKAGRRKKKAVFASPPGWSKHQDGTAVDINRAHDDLTDNDIADGLTDMWLKANAHRFGFINDVDVEPWHWRHLGSALDGYEAVAIL